MRRFGNVLMVLGALVGTLIGVGLLLGVSWPSLPWIVNVALVKLGLVSSVGLMGAGAAAVRVGRRQEERELPRRDEPRQIT